MCSQGVWSWCVVKTCSQDVCLSRVVKICGQEVWSIWQASTSLVITRPLVQFQEQSIKDIWVLFFEISMRAGE